MTRLLYVADPMCAWCWGFVPVLSELEPELRADVRVELVLGGLAPDDDAPMPEETRRYVQSAWRAVAARTGVEFDHAFWTRCRPRRSTWPACRAVLAAGEHDRAMFAAIQRAYYREARNPSELETLVELAGELGLGPPAFRAALEDPRTQERLEEHFALRDELGAHGFPSVGLERAGPTSDRRLLTRGWVDAGTLRDALAREDLLA